MVRKTRPPLPKKFAPWARSSLEPVPGIRVNRTLSNPGASKAKVPESSVQEEKIGTPGMLVSTATL